MTKLSICPRCGIEFENKTNRTFCCRKCANVRVHSEETKRKISSSVKKYNIDNKIINHNSKEGIIYKSRVENYYKNPKLCKICNNIIVYEDRNHKTCKNCRKLSWKGTGGYREGSGRSKFGYYKGIYCGSTYELVFVIYCLDHNIKFERFNKLLTDGCIKYYPDFIVNNELVEIKGFYTEAVQRKTDLAIKLGYKIKVLYKNDIQYMFDYVRNNYNYKNIIELYDNYKPNYKYICNNCNKIKYLDIERVLLCQRTKKNTAIRV